MKLYKTAINKPVIIECSAMLSAPALSSAPILRDKAEEQPTHIPFESAIAIIKKGRMYPMAAMPRSPTPSTTESVKKF